MLKPLTAEDQECVRNETGMEGGSDGGRGAMSDLNTQILPQPAETPPFYLASKTEGV